MKRIPFLAMAIFTTVLSYYLRVSFLNAGVIEYYLKYLDYMIFAGAITTLFLLMPKRNVLVLRIQSAALFLYSLFLLYFIIHFETNQPGTIYQVDFFFGTEWFYKRDITGIAHAITDLELYALFVYVLVLLANFLCSKPYVSIRKDFKYGMILLAILASIAMPFWYVCVMILDYDSVSWLLVLDVWLFPLTAFLLWMILAHLDQQSFSKTTLKALYIAYPMGVALPYFLLLPVIEIIEGEWFLNPVVDVLNLMSFVISFIFAIGLLAAIKKRQINYLKIISFVYWISMFVYWVVIFAISFRGGVA